MNPSSHTEWGRVSALFNELVDLDSDRRQTRLALLDPSLRKSVESLLAADALAEENLARFDAGLSSVVRRNIAPTVDSGDPLQIAGKTFSHFRVLDYLASGGMGIVYRAEDTRLRRPVALKFPLPHHQLDDRMKERFLREAKAAGSLEHINLCTVYEAGESEKGLFLAMPLYSGTTLKERLAGGNALSVDESLGITRQIATGLAHAHAAGIIHRDLKPGNVMLLPDGVVKILDFGLAKAGDLSSTRSSVTLGTVSYMAPEQIRGGKVDARADLWSIGVLLYEMLTGSRPFGGEHEASIAHAILHHDPKLPSSLRDDLPRQLQELVMSLLQKDPRHRYDFAANLASDVAAIEHGAAISFRPRAPSRVTKWALRHRMPLLASLLIIIAGIAASAPRLSSALNKPTKNPDAYRFYLIARDYELRGSMAPAESLYLRALMLDSGFALARARLAVVFAQCQAGGSRDCYRRGLEDRRKDRLELIKSEAQKALLQKPGLADAHFALGLYWEQREEPALALGEYARAKRGLARAGELHAAMARAYRAQGRWTDAISELERAISLDPRDANSMADLATTYSRLRRYRESAQMWDRYLAVAPDAYQGMVIRGHVYLRWLGTVDSLAAIVERLPGEWQKRSFTTRVLIARIQNRPHDALAALDNAPVRVPDDPTAFNSKPLLRAQVLSDMGDSARARIYYDSARMQLESIRAARPKDFRTQVALGLAYAGLGRSGDAVRAANRAMELMPPSRTMPLGTTAMRGAAEIFAQIPFYHGRAVDLLDRLMQLPAGREASVPLLRVDPAWSSLRSEPAFRRLLAKYSSN